MQLRNIFLALALGASSVLADFWIFYEGMSEEVAGYRFLHREDPTCHEISQADHWPFWTDDVSQETGIRLFDRGEQNPQKPGGMEVNTGRVHFTLYESRNWGIFDLDDRPHGHCYSRLDTRPKSWNCPMDKWKGKEGQLIFYCASDYDVTHFN
ncbi:hypothetical protein PG996_007935 [Apiospora saccharicola]|uniref:Uncharacterized protein n=1 Tax=Apiospora saccharicola TaxID=335842 RepID=A0ABR1UWI6_9PEZI